MRTVLMVIGIWVGASMFTAVVFAVGAGMGHRLAVDAFRQAGVHEQDQVPLDAT